MDNSSGSSVENSFWDMLFWVLSSMGVGFLWLYLSLLDASSKINTDLITLGLK